MEKTEIGQILHAVDNSVSSDFYKRYLHDFVHIVHCSKLSDTEVVSIEYKVSLA